jgi:hypothetical protein
VSITPSSGALAGGYPVTLRGSNLPHGWTVLFGDIPAQVVQDNAPTEIIVTAPGRGGSSGSVLVSLQSPDKSQLLSLWKFIYLQAGQTTPPSGGTAPGAPGGGTAPGTPGGGTAPGAPGGGTAPGAPSGNQMPALPALPYGAPSQGRIRLGNGVSLVGVGTRLSGVTSGIWGFAPCGVSCDAITI